MVQKKVTAMTNLLRILLIVISTLTFVYIIFNIRKAKVKIDALFFWILFGLFLIILSVFPQLANIGTMLTGFYAPVNFVIITIIFLLIYKVFTLSIKLSKLQSKLDELVQKLALKDYEDSHLSEKDSVE